MIRAVYILGMLGFSVAMAAPVVVSRKMDGRQVALTLQGFNGAATPERVIARVDGQEIEATPLSMLPLRVGIFVDTSVGCSLTQMARPLSIHIEKLLHAMPASTRSSIVGFFGQSTTALRTDARVSEIGAVPVTCNNSRSMSVGDLALSLVSSAAPFDLVVIYSSGNFNLDESRAAAFSRMGKKRFVLTYLPRADGPDRASGESVFSTRSPKEPPSAWLASLVSPIVSSLAPGGLVTVTLPGTLKSGEYRLELDFISNGVSLGQTGVYLSYVEGGRAGSLPKKSLPLWVYALAATILAEIGVLLWGYYRTPRCPKCAKPVLRPYKVCGFCLKSGDALVAAREGEATHLLSVKDFLSVGSTRDFGVRLRSIPGEGGFQVLRHEGIYQIDSQHPALHLNSEAVAGNRFLQSGDVISMGGFSCTFYVRN